MRTPFEHGLDLFAAGQYYEAHEAWEELWIPAPRQDRFFLQALIHFAVALHHRSEGNAEGEARQWRKALRKLAGYLPSYGGLDTGDLYRQALGGPGPLTVRRATISEER